jgi:hypothetical protein
MKIKLKIVKLELTLVVQILEQDLGFNMNNQTTLPNGVQIRRDNGYPHFNSIRDRVPMIYIRSNKPNIWRSPMNDFRSSLLEFSSNEERDRYCKLILESIELWSRG